MLKWLIQQSQSVRSPWQRWGMVVTGLAFGLFVAIATLLPQIETLDTQILLAIHHFHTPTLDRLMVLVTYLGEPLILFPFTLAMGGILLWQKRRQEALGFVIAIGGSLGLNIWLKELFARHRPALWDQILQVPFYSFPSGHAMVSLVFYAVLVYGLIRQFRSFRLLMVAVGTSLIATIGFSRLYIGVHWPTDVVAGYAAGLVWLAVCLIFQSLLLARPRETASD
ncbi:phosphatase PAP2 family protein [Acaryochloris marina]|uniref:Phosphoesterase, PA-phosphatase related protein n=1 Tax=Acaryochloris marina (strain MBIC 11017) TaxID=329726 RepID=B0C4I1_ACAM1|nr:phosphatase PAP2 family protein [Acaryochloris marina]ABW28724.1 phosphoesterase, PA-phosphatase related protein [Acaryochloris marina MBIC11017]BDM77714.1 phosphatidylglycerophosphatase B [Acaryochloris marina MBIC10699]